MRRACGLVSGRRGMGLRPMPPPSAPGAATACRGMTRSVMPRLTSLVLLLTALASCSTTPPAPRPDWVDRPSAARSEALYLSAVGAGATRDEAHDRALARLAEQLTADVRSRTVTARGAWMRSRDGATPDTSEMLDEQSVVVVSSRTALVAASIAEHWRDRASGAHYALAVLDRQRATTFYDEWMAGHEEWVSRQLEAAERAGPTWQRLQALGSALSHARRRDELATIRAVVAPFDAAPAAPRLEPSVFANWDDACITLPFEIDPQLRTADSRLRTALTDALESAGLQHRESVDAPLRVRLIGRIAPEPTYREGEAVLRHAYSIAFINTSDGATVSTIACEGWSYSRNDLGRLHRSLATLNPGTLRPPAGDLVSGFLRLNPPDIVLLSAPPGGRAP